MLIGNLQIPFDFIILMGQFRIMRFTFRFTMLCSLRTRCRKKKTCTFKVNTNGIFATNQRYVKRLVATIKHYKNRFM